VQARAIPESPIYIRVTLEGRELHVLRVPSTLQAALLFSKIDGPALQKLALRLGDARSIADILAVTMGAGPEILGAFGYLIGVAWFHEVQDLETVRAQGEDPFAYGGRVLEEMHEAGYTLQEQLLLGTTILADWTHRQVVVQEAVETAGFSEPQPVA
jgi:hypothetical protein